MGKKKDNKIRKQHPIQNVFFSIILIIGLFFAYHGIEIIALFFLGIALIWGFFLFTPFKKIIKSDFYNDDYLIFYLITYITAFLYIITLGVTTLSFSISSGGSWINLGIFPHLNYEYNWHTVISITFSIVIILLGVKFYSKKLDIYKTILLTSSIVLIGFGSFFITKLIAPSFYLKHIQTPEISFIRDDNTIDIQKYIELELKCREEKNYCFVERLEHENLTIDDYITLMEAAKKHDFKKLYNLPNQYNRDDWEKIIKELIVKYNDKTFQAYLISNSGIANIYDTMQINSFDAEISYLLKSYKKQINYYQQNKSHLDKDYLNDLRNKNKSLLKNLNNVNFNLIK